MKKLYEKSKLGFSLVWIAIYVVLLSVADELSLLLNIDKIITAPLCLALTIFLFVWLKKNGLFNEYGLCKSNKSAKRFLYYLPLLILVSVNFWQGVKQPQSIYEAILYIISMLCVGFLEEIVFRGFLFNALKKDSLIAAIIVSSLTFGFGHIINLLSGADLISTLLQIVYATAAGLLFTIIFHKSGSLLFPIITHSLLNATSLFCNDGDFTMQIITSCALTVVAVAYALIILALNKESEIKKVEKKEGVNDCPPEKNDGE